jgi:hypothetical protein
LNFVFEYVAPIVAAPNVYAPPAPMTWYVFALFAYVP